MTWRDHPVVRTVMAVQRRYRADAGGNMAAAITYYGFLSLFPLLLLGMSALGFVLAGDPVSQREWAERLSRSIPGLEPLIGDNFQALIRGRAATGLLGLAGLLWTGRGLAESATKALARVYRLPKYKKFLRQKAWAIGSTLVLGALALVAVAVLGVVTNLPVEGPGAVALGVFGALLALALDVVVFGAAYRVLMPRTGPPLPVLWPGPLLAATGWAALKLIGGWYVVRLLPQTTAVYGTFAGTVVVLLLLNLAARLFLYGAELNAILMDREGGDRVASAREGTDVTEDGGRSTPEILRSIAVDTTTLVRKEVELAREEIVEAVVARVKAAGAMIGAGLLTALTLAFLGSAVAVALEGPLTAWGARLVVAGGFLFMTLVAVVFGLIRLRRPPMAPEETKRTIKEDVRWARAQLKR